MRGRRLRWLIVALVAAGCGAGISWYATRDTPLPGGPNRLALYETNLRRGVVYTEGFQSYLAVAAAAGGSETVTVPYSHRVAFSKRLAAGRYTIKSWLRPCDGNCGTLGGATDRCQLTITLGRNQPTNYDVVVTPGHGCRIERIAHG